MPCLLLWKESSILKPLGEVKDDKYKARFGQVRRKSSKSGRFFFIFYLILDTEI